MRYSDIRLRLIVGHARHLELSLAAEGDKMIRCIGFVAFVAVVVSLTPLESHAQQRGFGQGWGASNSHTNWERFYHYPYVYYPQNYWGGDYYRSADDLYYRYPQEMRVPVYNRKWYNYYPTARLYHRGHHFNLDVF